MSTATSTQTPPATPAPDDLPTVSSTGPVPGPVQGLTRLHDTPGYHEWVIERGELGEISKVVEEALEAADAADQGADIMVLVELADLIGSVQAYLAKHHPTITLADLEKFAGITARAFTSGRRQ